MRMYDRGPEMRLLCSCCNIHAVCQEHPPWEVDIGLPSRHKRGAAGGGGGGDGWAGPHAQDAVCWTESCGALSLHSVAPIAAQTVPPRRRLPPGECKCWTGWSGAAGCLLWRASATSCSAAPCPQCMPCPTSPHCRSAWASCWSSYSRWRRRRGRWCCRTIQVMTQRPCRLPPAGYPGRRQRGGGAAAGRGSAASPCAPELPAE